MELAEIRLLSASEALSTPFSVLREKVDFSALESTSAAQLKETKEMNQTNKRLLRQNETLMRELITKTGNSSLANTV